VTCGRVACPQEVESSSPGFKAPSSEVFKHRCRLGRQKTAKGSRRKEVQVPEHPYTIVSAGGEDPPILRPRWP